MNAAQLAVAGISGNLGMLKMHLNDFSDADMLVRPAPNANHTMWQIGHLLCTEAWMINQCAPGAVPPPPAGWAEKFKKETSTVDDPKAFPTKAELLAAYDSLRESVIKWIGSLSDADMDKPGPAPMRDFCPTFGALASLIPVHLAMHMGQVQVIRRKLGKPVMF